MTRIVADVVVVGGGLGGVAAALAAADRGATVVLTSDQIWLGGQLTSQGVPPDEAPWVERLGGSASYRRLRDAIRARYRSLPHLSPALRDVAALNPGGGWVSKLCAEPTVAAAVIDDLLRPYEAAGSIRVWRSWRPVAVERVGDRIRSVQFADAEGDAPVVHGRYFVDATEDGALLPLAGTGYVTGQEGVANTGEPSAADTADPQDMQAFTWCLAIEAVDGHHVTDPPASYEAWRSYLPDGWPGPLLSWTYPNPRTLLPTTPVFEPDASPSPAEVVAGEGRIAATPNLWTYRRLRSRAAHANAGWSDVTLVNWPQNDYWRRSVIDVPDTERSRAHQEAKELSLCLLHWIQTEAPRPDGGVGWPGVRPSRETFGTVDGLAHEPYLREVRRIRSLTTIREQDVVPGRGRARVWEDSVGTGAYRIDLHPTTGGRPYLDRPTHPFEIPLGALIPTDTANLLAGGKNLGTTHVTNGCYRLHPVEWNTGEAAGLVAALCVAAGVDPVAVHQTPRLRDDLLRSIDNRGILRHWPADLASVEL